MVPLSKKAPPIHISTTGQSPVVFSFDDVDRFVKSQRDVIGAVLAHEQEKEARDLLGEAIAAWVYRLKQWCKDRLVGSCVIDPRMDDILVVITAQDEDPGGLLHDQMSELDLESFRKNRLRLSWLLLRASEANGISAFADETTARMIYNADQT